MTDEARPWVAPILDGWRDLWHHRIESKGITPEAHAAAMERELLDQAIPDLLHAVGAISDPHDEEVARVSLAALLGAHHAVRAAHVEGELTNEGYEAIDSFLARGAFPWLHALGYRPECNDPPAVDLTVDVRCPGCGQRLYGPIAERGACLGCFPEVPVAPDEHP